MSNDQALPEQSVLLAAYSTTMEAFKNEETLIWMRTGVFIAFNTVVAGAINYVQALPGPVRLLVAIFGGLFAVCWHFSMRRLWGYQQYYVCMLRKLERKLNLGDYGPFLFGREIAEGAEKSIDGEPIRLPAAALVFRAKVLAHSVTWLFFAAYLALAIKEIVSIRAS